MDDFGMLARDFGFRPQGKSAPMKSEGGGGDRRSPFSGEDQNRDGLLFNDVFGGPPKFTNSSSTKMSDFDYDSIFKSSDTKTKSSSAASAGVSSFPVYDKPVYDDDIFDGLPGLKSKSMSSSSYSGTYDENVFASMASSSPPKRSQQSDHFDDLLGNLGKVDRKMNETKSSTARGGGFDDLLPGFGSGSPSVSTRSNSEPLATGNTKETTSNVMEDPFVVIDSTSTPVASSPSFFADPLEEIGNFSKSGSTNPKGSSVSSGVFDDLDPLSGFGKSRPAFSSDTNNRGKDQSPSRVGTARTPTTREPVEKSSFASSETHSQKKVPVDDFRETHPPIFDMPDASRDSQRSFDQASPPSYTNASYAETHSKVDMSPRSEEHIQSSDDIWLTVSEIPLFTQPTRAPPPSRPPPQIPRHASKSERGTFASNARKVGNNFSSSPNSVQYSQSPRPFQPTVKSPTSSHLDDLENFATGRTWNNVDENFDAHSGEEMNSNSAAAASAAAMKDAMDRAEAKFKHAKEVREREHAKAAKNKEAVQMEKDEHGMEEAEDLRERQDILDRERRQREREEEEREKRRLEKERTREVERDKARQAVERATREARERAAAEARDRAAAEARLKAERAAVQRAQAEARGRAAIDARERAERAAAEARERAAAEARERTAAEARERAAAEARERAAAEAREKDAKAAVARAEADARRRAERAAVQRVAAEARERAAAEARERAAAAARASQQRSDDDLESFFSTRANSVPRPRTTSSDPTMDPLSQSRGGPEAAKRTSSSGIPSSMRKASSATNIVDDLSSIFGASMPAGEFQDVEGETEERRRARLERHQRTQERAAKALAEKNQRDLQSQREQEERHRIAETLDIEIKRWAAGKEGNLRALLSTLQYVLWPECGWQPVSLTDLIAGASVKKVYRKATLCIHPDKVQQKGATLQQKYIAEKVFDLLKEAWNKFNSEELF